MDPDTKTRSSAEELGSAGAFRLVAEIARGELSTVYLAARGPGTGSVRRAVIKRILPQFADSPEWRALLSEEAHIAAAVHHPNVVSVLPDTGESGGAVLFEYIDGETLENLLARADISLKPKLLVSIFADVLRGLTAIHTASDADGGPLGFVHQAPRARHIVVGTDGGSRLIDFSQALRTGAPALRARADRLHVAYMAQEQALDPDNVDQRTDIFVVGIALWEALTGERLFRAEAADQTFQNMLHRAVPQASITGRKPPAAFDALCARALQRDPDKRFQTAADMLGALTEVGRAIGGPASAFEVGQWVMAIAGAALRARHGHLSGSMAPAAGSARPPASGASWSMAGSPASSPSVGPVARGSAPASLSSTISGHPPGPLVVSRPPRKERPSDPVAGRATLSSAPPAASRTTPPPEKRPSAPASSTPTSPAPPSSTPPSSATEPPTTKRPSSPAPDLAVLRTVPVSNASPAFGITTMVGGYAIPPGKSAAPSRAGSGEGGARSRVHTIQNMAAVTIADPGSSSAPPPRLGSDAPTEVLSAEQARELTALVAATSPHSDAVVASPQRTGRSTEQMFSMPSPAPSGQSQDRAARAQPQDRHASVPDETVIDDRASLGRDVHAASRSDAPVRLEAIVAAPPAAAEPVAMTQSIRPRRVPIEVNESVPAPGTALALGSHSSRGVLEREMHPRVGPRSHSPRSMVPGRDVLNLNALVFVPSLEGDGDDEALWGKVAVEVVTGRSTRPSYRSATSIPPASRRRVAWAAIFAAIAIAAGVLAFGAQTVENGPDGELEDEAEETPPGVPTPRGVTGLSRSAIPQGPAANPSPAPSSPPETVPPPPLTRALPSGAPPSAPVPSAPASGTPASGTPASGTPAPNASAPSTASQPEATPRSSHRSRRSSAASADAGAGAPNATSSSGESSKPGATSDKPKDDPAKSPADVFPYNNPY